VKERTADLAKINTELQASHKRFTTVLNSISANIYVAHIDTDEILFMNKHMQDEFGGNFIGQKCFQALKKADERCPFCPAPVLVDSNGKPTKGYIWESFNETTQRWYLNNDRAITWVDGQIVRLEVSIDVTDKKDAESALLQLNEDLEKRVADRTSELAEKNELLQTEIGEHEQTERELRQSEERFRQAVDNSPNPIFTVDVNGRIQDWNKSFNEIFKYKKDIMDQDIIFLFPDKENQIAARRMLSDVLEQKNLTDVELCYRCEDGSHRYMVSRVYPVFDQQGKIDHCVFTNTDITERKRALIELNKAKEHAEAASRAKSDFLANMSHELRTPLNHIIGFTELIVDQHFGDLNPSQVEYLNDVLLSAKHLLSLVNDILDISKVEAGKLELEAELVDIRQLLENSLVMVKEKALRHGIRLALDMDGIPETIIADERKLKQVLYNLLANAVKFTPDGGKVICRASVLEPAEHIKISVIDTGIGIEPDDLDRIFKPFEQVDGSISRQFGGTGLGLSLTQQLVELHGGKIWAESDIDKHGSQFHFTIPIENGRYS
jgi:PAS domain S-box-containing protein